MKKKVLAFLLASTMVIEPFSVASAADFSDGMGQNTVQFSDDAEDVPEVENDDVNQFGTDAVGEGEESTETHVQIGDKVWVDFDNVNGIATISGSGSTWDYYQDGTAVPDYKFKNPFVNKEFNKIVIEKGITRLGNYLFYAANAQNTQICELKIADTVTEIGKYSFYKVQKLQMLQLPSSVQKVDESAFELIRSLKILQLNEGLKIIENRAFYSTGINNIQLPQSVTKIGEYVFSQCSSLSNVEGFERLTNIPKGIFEGCPIKSFDFSNAVQIGIAAFRNTQLQEIDTLTEKLTKIDVSAFSQCKVLKTVNIPNSVKEIGSSAFEGTAIEKIVIPNSVITLGWGAFSECKDLYDVELPNNQLSLKNTFIGCVGLKSIVIPENVIELGDTFVGCIRLHDVTIRGQKTKFLRYAVDGAEHPFVGCDSLQYISSYDCSYAKKLATDNNIPFKTLGEKDHQFTAEKVQIKEPTCTEEGSKAYKCEICGFIEEEEEIAAYGHSWGRGVEIKPATETEEGEIKYICWRCRETKIETIPKLSAINLQIDENEQYWNGHYQYRFWCTSNKDVTYYAECVKKDSEQPVYNSTKKDGEIDADSGRWINVDITDEDAVDIYIFAANTNGDYVCKKVTPDYTQRPQKPVYQVGGNVTATVDGDTLTLTGTGETYEDYYWRDRNDSDNRLNKTSIKHIIVENGITSLGSELFSHFENVESIILPTSLEYIGTGAFSNCYSLENIEIPNGVKALGSYIFNECERLKSISLPSTLTTVPGLIDIDGENVETVILNKGIERIGNSAFQNMNNLKNIIIPDSVSSIGQWAFASCNSLSNITLPDSITAIEEGAFSDCTSLDKIILPNNLTSLGNDVFEYCNAEITFPSGLERIPELGMNATRKVNIPEGVKIIGEDAFWACSNLKEITLPSTITSIESGAFFNTSISGFNYPQNIDSIPINAFCGTKLTEFSVPPKVTEINDDAFYNCTDLVKISIPESVKYIGTDVFKNCRNLTIYGYKDTAAESYANAHNIKFISADYKVIFKDNGRTQKTEYVLEGENATPPSLKEKPGYTLSWDADYTNIQEDMVINAVWTKKDNGGGNTTIIVSPSETNKYTVTFKDRGEVIKTEKVKSGDAAEYPFITRSGYKLSWDKDFSKVTANITVNAVWTVIKPEKVTSLTAESGKKSIALSWDETEYAGYYLVYRKADSEKEYTQVAKTTKILWTDSKAVPGTQYSYKVVAVRSLSGKKYQGAESDVVTTKIGTPQIGDTYSVGDLNYKLTGTKEVTVTGLAKVTDTLVIPSSVTISGKVYKVTAIQDKAFYRNEDIVNVTIGNNVVNVGKYAFYQCSGLETVKFGKRVAIINTCAFTQCPNLENVTLPSSIRKIGAKAFYQCTSIKIFKINGSVLEYVGKKGLAINKTVTLRLPKKPYSSYRKLIKASSVYVKTKFVKF